MLLLKFLNISQFCLLLIFWDSITLWVSSSVAVDFINWFVFKKKRKHNSSASDNDWLCSLLSMVKQFMWTSQLLNTFWGFWWYFCCISFKHLSPPHVPRSQILCIRASWCVGAFFRDMVARVQGQLTSTTEVYRVMMLLQMRSLCERKKLFIFSFFQRAVHTLLKCTRNCLGILCIDRINNKLGETGSISLSLGTDLSLSRWQPVL